jgi:fructan beta-fructosidase
MIKDKMAHRTEVRNFIRRFLTVCWAMVFLAAPAPALHAQNASADTGTGRLYDEPYRPQFHFTPARNWTNDPNGPIYYEHEYHLFYQYNPEGNDWGHMSWGHAVSPDMVHWRNLPVALREEDGIMIFSGSTVVDWNNSSGFCTGKKRSCLVAIYTGHSNNLQTQNLAYSNDKGRTWTKYSGNPVIDLHMSAFRDPKVFWHEGTHRWIMVTVLASLHKVRFFASTDLKHWTALSDFGPAGASSGAWECPDLFRLSVKNSPGASKWVLSINVNPGGPYGGSANQYFVGTFDGTTFANENPPDQTLWADYGEDFYASTSFSGIPESDGRHIWLGWLSNWAYAGKVPTAPWRGSQSIPRELALWHFAEGLRLVQQPVKELEALRENNVSLQNSSIEAANRVLREKHVQGECLEIEIEFKADSAGQAGLKVRKGAHEETVIGIVPAESKLFLDRSAGPIFDKSFLARQEAALRLDTSRRIKLRIFVDRSSVEVFANHGETVLSSLIFPSADSDGVELYSDGGNASVVTMNVWKLKSIY